MFQQEVVSYCAAVRVVRRTANLFQSMQVTNLFFEKR